MSSRRKANKKDDEAGFHQLVVATRRILEKQTPDGYGLLTPCDDGTMKVRVSPEALPRALDILQHVIVGAEVRQWSVQPREGYGRDKEARLRIGEQEISFSITEESRKQKQTWEQKIHGIRSYRPTGKLKLAFECWSDVEIQKSWSDGSTQKVEQFITDFLDNIAAGAESVRKRNAKWARSRRREELRALRVANERDRRTEVFRQAKRWRKSSDLRAMIGKLRDVAAERSWSDDEVHRWIEWAEALVRRTDPFANGYFERVLKTKRFFPNLDIPEPPKWGARY